MEEVFCSNETLCYPWSGVIATALSNKTQLKNELSLLGIDYLKVNIVWDCDGFSGFAVVEFHHSILGLYELLKTEKAFSEKSCGRKDYYGGVRNALCFWVAREDEYRSPKVGKYLKKNVDLMTVQEYLEREKRKDKTLLSSLQMKLKEKNLMLKELEDKHGEITNFQFKMIEEIDKLNKEKAIKFEEGEQAVLHPSKKARLEDDSKFAKEEPQEVSEDQADSSKTQHHGARSEHKTE